jgi:triphosphoribosyl-dephospho-CoA synthase
LKTINPMFCAGVFIEPLIHPKPGGVTRIESHMDKSIYNFTLNNIVFCSVALRGQSRSLEKCSIGKEFENLAYFLNKHGLRCNTSLGSWVLHVPIILSARSIGEYHYSSIKPLVNAAVELIKSSDSCDTMGYFRLLKYYSPSHLGRLRRGGVDINEYEEHGLPSFYDVVRTAGRGDIVHRELIQGYTLSMEALRSIEEFVARDFSFENAVFHTLIRLMSRYIDTLIARKYGIVVALRILKMANMVLEEKMKFEELDSFMRRNELNPGSLLDVLSMGITFYFVKNSRSGFDEKVLLY